jgi:hypothetical protein
MGLDQRCGSLRSAHVQALQPPHACGDGQRSEPDHHRSRSTLDCDEKRLARWETGGESAFEFERQSVVDLVSLSSDLDHVIQQSYRGEQLAREFHERHLDARRQLDFRRLKRSGLRAGPV